MEQAPGDFIFTAIIWMVCISVVWWGIESLVFAFRRRYVVPEVSSIPVDDYVEEAQTEQTDEADRRSSALYDAADQLRLDRTRKVIIDTLLLAGWDVAEIRGQIKGDNNTLSAEINAARQRLGLTSNRVLIIRQGGEARQVKMEA